MSTVIQNGNLLVLRRSVGSDAAISGSVYQDQLVVVQPRGVPERLEFLIHAGTNGNVGFVV